MEARADHDRDLLATEAASGAAAIHRGIPAAQDDDTPADLLNMSKRDVREPIDPDMDVGGRLASSRDLEVTPAWRAGSEENRVIALAEQLA